MSEEKQKQQMQQFPEDDEPPFSGGVYLTREMLETPLKPMTREEKIRLQRLINSWRAQGMKITGDIDIDSTK